MLTTRRHYICIAVILVMVSFSGGYLISNYTRAPTGKTSPVLTLVDGAGRIVDIAGTPERIVSLGGSITETLYALGCGDMVVGVDESSDYPPSVREKVNLGSPSRPDLGKIIDLRPDFVFTWRIEETIGALEKEGLNVFAIDPRLISDQLLTIRTIGLIVGKAEEAIDLTAQIQVKIDEMTAKIKSLGKADRPFVYFEITPMRTVGPGTYTNEAIFMAGGINIAAEEPERFPILSKEFIIQRNPDVIVVVSYGTPPEEIKAREGWQMIKAVKNDRVYAFDWRLITCSPRLYQGLEQLANWFHPGLFD